MSDWLDSPEFYDVIVECLSPTERGGLFDTGELKAAIRSHFVPKPQWTTITEDRLSWPPSHASILLTMRDDNGNLDVRFGIWRPQFDIPKDWIAWMPMPEPYRGENGQD